MTADPAKTADFSAHPLAQTYRIAELASIITLAMAVAERTGGMWSFVVPLVALTGAFLRWPQAPVLVMLTTTAAVFASQRFSRPTLINDVIVAMSVMVFTICHFRYIGFVDATLPRDPRRRLARPAEYAGFFFRRSQTPADPPLRRDPAKAPGDELPITVILILVSIASALLLWMSLPVGLGPFGIRAGMWRVGLLGVIVFGLGLLMASGLAVWRWRQWSADEAEMVVRNAVWQETRGEQRQIARWGVEGQLRRKRK